MKTFLILLLIFSVIPVLSAQEPADTIPAPQFFERGTDVYNVVELMPCYPGCEQLGSKEERDDCSMRKMLTFLYSKIQYPEKARENGVTGVAEVGFIVDKDGSLSNFKILKDPGAGCGEECLRVVKLMPNFIPGKQRGQPVRVEYSIPLKFSVR